MRLTFFLELQLREKSRDGEKSRDEWRPNLFLLLTDSKIFADRKFELFDKNLLKCV